MNTTLTHPHDDHPYAPQAERQLPSNLECEQAILGAVLSNNEAMNHVGGELKPEHFYAQIHQRIYAAILKHIDEGKVVTAVTLKNYFSGEEGIESQYLARLVASATSVVNLHDYARIVTELAMRRMIIRSSEDVVKEALNPATLKSAADLSGMMANAITDVTKNIASRRMRSSKETSRALIEYLSKPHPKTSTGIGRLDKALGGGFARGQVYGIAARPGYGKTMIAGTISHNLNYSGKRHLFVCAEMGDEEIHARSIARKVGCPTMKLYSEEPEDFHYLTAAAGVAHDDPGNVFYQSESFLTFDGLKQFVANAVARHHVEGFILDYFQLVRGMAKGGNLVMHLEEVAQWLAAICKKENIWALVTAQLNDEGKSRWGDSMEMAFTNLFYLHRVNDAGEPDKNGAFAWLQMDKMRHSDMVHVGGPKYPAFMINGNGPFFEERHDDGTVDHAQYSMLTPKKKEWKPKQPAKPRKAKAATSTDAPDKDDPRFQEEIELGMTP